MHSAVWGTPLPVRVTISANMFLIHHDPGCWRVLLRMPPPQHNITSRRPQFRDSCATVSPTVLPHLLVAIQFGTTGPGFSQHKFPHPHSNFCLQNISWIVHVHDTSPNLGTQSGLNATFVHLSHPEKVLFSNLLASPSSLSTFPTYLRFRLAFSDSPCLPAHSVNRVWTLLGSACLRVLFSPFPENIALPLVLKLSMPWAQEQGSTIRILRIDWSLSPPRLTAKIFLKK